MNLTRSTVLKILTYMLLIIGAFVSLVPFVFMISTSLKTIGEALGTQFFPKIPQWEN